MNDRHRKSRRLLPILASVAWVSLAWGPGVWAENPSQTVEQLEERLQSLSQQLQDLQEERARIQELERQIQLLTQELQDIRTELAGVAEGSELQPQYGLAPAASKIYSVARGISLAGYGQAWAQFFDEDERDQADTADFLRYVQYIGYKFSDTILFNSEIEFEHATTDSTVSAGEGSVSVEFAYLDFLYDDPLNFRAGLLLVPMGFLNEVHEPTTYFGNQRPETERSILPTTWRELGLGIFGTLGRNLEYRSYLINGLDARGFRDSGIRGGRQSGNRVRFEDAAWVTRADYFFTPSTFLGGSLYIGNSGQEETFAGSRPNVETAIWDGHFQFQHRGFRFRALAAGIHLDDVELVSRQVGTTVAEQQFGWYVEGAYNIMPWFDPDSRMTLEPFVRFENFDTQNDVPTGFVANQRRDIDLTTVGIAFKPIPNIVFKGDYRVFESEGGDLNDEFNVGFGFVY